MHHSALYAEALKRLGSLDGAKLNELNEINKLFGEKLYIRTKNFKNFFGDWEKDPENSSKIVDENGEPMVVYHQTGNDFTVFDPRHKGAGTNDYQVPFGIFMKPSAPPSPSCNPRNQSHVAGLGLCKKIVIKNKD